jgi:hypothetical protein
MSHRLTGALCHLWSVLLPHAVFSPGSDANAAVAGGDCIVQNKAWKALSFLAFGSSVTERLWVAVERPVKGSTVPVRAPDAQTRGSLTSDSESEKKNEGKSQTRAFGGFMSVFGFNYSSSSGSGSGGNSGKGKKGTGASKDKDDVDNSNKGERSANSRADERHLSISSGVDVEDYASYSFSPAIHLDPQSLDFRFTILITFAVFENDPGCHR